MEEQTIKVVTRTLLHAKLNGDGGMTIKYKAVLTKDDVNTFEVEDEPTSKALAHADLTGLFAPLAIHLRASAEWKAPDKDFTARSITLTPPKKEGDGTTCTISGYRKLKSKKVVNFNSPPIRFSTANEPYEGADQLEVLVDEIEHECFRYLDGHHQPPPQQAMEFPKDTDAEGNPIDGSTRDEALAAANSTPVDQ